MHLQKIPPANKAFLLFFPFLLSFTLVWICLNAREGRSEHFPLGMACEERIKVHSLLQCHPLPSQTGIQTPKIAEPYCRQLFLEHYYYYYFCPLSCCWSIWVTQACESLFQQAQINDLCSKYFMDSFSQLIFILSIPVDIMDCFSGN